MGMLENLFGKVSEREALISRAAKVGDVNDVIRLGIEAAKLGLTEDDLERMARVYYMIQFTPINEMDYVVIKRILEAIRLAHEGS